MVTITITPRNKRTKSEQLGSKLVITCNNNAARRLVHDELINFEKLQLASYEKSLKHKTNI